VQAARKEGSVVVLGSPGGTQRAAVVEPFQSAFPGITVEYNTGRLNDIWPRMQAERAAGKYLWDVLLAGGTGAVRTLKPVDAVANLKPQLALPEVVDVSLWLNNHLWWVDAKEPMTTLNYQGNVQLIVAYNKDLVKDPSQFTSYKDLLDSKWRGKIVATDLRKTTVGAVPARFIYNSKELGAPFLDRLYGDMDVTLSVDQNQLVDWLASGQFALGLFLSPQNVTVAIDQGLPIAYVPGEQFKEGAAIGPSTGSVTLMQPAAHPNAAKLLANWLLSKQGQLSWQKNVAAPSLRTDVPRDGVYPLFVPKPGFKYEDGGAEAFGAQSDSAVEDTIDRAQQRAKR
jgi:iron(III) transport system substrate-binding protein